MDGQGIDFDYIEKPTLELSGQDGNAFMIMGLASRTAKRSGWNKARIDQYLKEAKRGDYDHLLRVTMKWFNVE